TGQDGLGFTVVTRDSTVHGPGPILVKSILPRGAAVRDGRLQSGDRILEVNGVDISGYRQEELVAMLRSTKQGETVSLLVSKQEEPFLPRELDRYVARIGVTGTWNVTSLGKKEPELVREVEQYRLASTHSLGSGTQFLERGWTLFYSGVPHAIQSCGRKLSGAGSSGNPRTQWWTLEVRDAVKLKKESYQACLAQGTLKTAEAYRRGLSDSGFSERGHVFDFGGAEKGEPSSLTLSEEGRGHLVYEIPVSDSGSAGLGLSLKGNKSRETGEDLGIFIKSIIHGGAAFKASHISLLTYDQIERKIDRDGRLRVNDQLVAVNGESLLGRSNNDAMETLRRSMSMEGNHRETIQLVILRALENSPTQERRQDGGQSRENPPAQYNHNDASNGVAQPPMVINSIYAHAPGPVSASNGRPGVYYDASDEDDFASHPSDMESDFNPQPKYAQNRAEREPASNPTYQLQHTQRHPKTSMSMDLVADEGNIGGKQPRRPAPKMSSLGPTLGLQKSSSLESLQTAMEEASKSSVPFHRPAGPMVRGRGCNMSFRQAIDKSYDGPSEPEDDYSEDSSGRETPASGSSRQELEDGGKDKKKKTKKKKEKKTKTKKKDDADDPDKKTKKKGFVLLRKFTFFLLWASDQCFSFIIINPLKTGKTPSPPLSPPPLTPPPPSITLSPPPSPSTLITINTITNITKIITTTITNTITTTITTITNITVTTTTITTTNTTTTITNTITINTITNITTITHITITKIITTTITNTITTTITTITNITVTTTTIATTTDTITTTITFTMTNTTINTITTTTDTITTTMFELGDCVRALNTVRKTVPKFRS
ncbi:hypothetical protein QTP86_034621, partial [Hemibagrus guttatus]